jgi:hypothetical protein
MPIQNGLNMTLAKSKKIAKAAAMKVARMKVDVVP